MPVLRVKCIPNDIVDRLATHKSMWHTRLAVQYGARIPQHLHHLTLKDLLFTSTLLTFEGADPAYVTHTGLDIFDMKLIFE